MLDQCIRIDYRGVRGGEYLFFSRGGEGRGWGCGGGRVGVGHKQFCLGTGKVVSDWDGVFRKMEMTLWNGCCEEVFMYTLGLAGDMLAGVFNNEESLKILKQHTTTLTLNILSRNYLVASYYDGTLKVFHLKNRSVKMSYKSLHNYPIENIVISPDEMSLFAVDAVGNFKQVDLDSKDIENCIVAYDELSVSKEVKNFEYGKVIVMACSSDSRYLFVVKNLDEILQIDIKARKVVRQLGRLLPESSASLRTKILGLDFDSESKYLFVSFAEDTNLVQICIESGEIVKDWDTEIFGAGFVNKKTNANYKNLLKNKQEIKALTLRNREWDLTCEKFEAEFKTSIVFFYF